MYFAARHKEASMQFSSSLKFNHVFRRLYNKGDSCANRYLVVYCRKNGTKRNRIGLTVGAKLGHAVARDLPAARGAVCPGLRYRCGRAHGCHAGSLPATGRGLSAFGRKARHLCAGSTRGDEGHMKRVLLGLIRFYQRFISPGLPRRCRFSPTCSQYAFEAIEKYGALKGGWLAFKRLMRCNPFYKGDYFDPVP